MKWINLGLKLFRQYQASQRNRDRLGGKTTKRAEPKTRAVPHGVQVEYSPELDGEADPGEVVWAWVPFEEDPNRGKDRPVVIVGHSQQDGERHLAGVPLTSKNKGRREHVPVGTGDWDPKRRQSWAKVDQLLALDHDDVRREGAILARDRFDDVIGNLGKYHTVSKR